MRTRAIRGLKANRAAWFLLPTFFIFLADSTLGYTFPIIAEKHLLSNTLLGFVMASSSIAGIICDVSFPTLLRGRGWGFQFLSGAALALLFPLATYVSAYFLPVLFAIIAAIVWGIYYELLEFSQQGMITEEREPAEFSRAWGTLYAVMLVTSVVGPILGAHLLLGSLAAHLGTIVLLQSLAIATASLIVWRMKSRRERDKTHAPPRCESALAHWLDFIRETRSWQVLLLAVLPAIILGIMTKWVEATYWTFGGLFGQSVSGTALGWLVIASYEIPLLLGALVLSRLSLTEHKKRWSQVALFIGGIVLMLVGFMRGQTLALYTVITLSSFAFAFATPLNEAVYSDLIKRLKGNKLRLIGLDKANSSFAYIFAPIVMGMLADRTDYYAMFAFVGAGAAIVAVLLIMVTPRKLRLPQAELSRLERENAHEK